MKRAVAFLLVFLATLVAITIGAASQDWLSVNQEIQLAFHCGLAGGFGGVVYCLRGIYLNASVRKNWDPAWLPWYFIRPFVSLIIGTVSFVFLRAGLIVLESDPRTQATHFGFLALAFIAGLNVDRFLVKLEDVAQATWGIRQSRTAERQDADN